MTASGIVTVTVRVTAPKIEIANVEFTAVSPSLPGHLNLTYLHTKAW